MKTKYHITENISFSSGGIRTIVELLHNYLLSNELDSKIITNLKENNDEFVEFKTNLPWFYNNEIINYLDSLKNAHLFHLHGVYTYSQYAASKIGIKNSIPYIVSPHGMLEPWILNKNPLKKKVYLKLILNKVLKNAKYLHAITPLEKENLFKLTRHKKIIEIPNLIDFNKVPKNTEYNPNEDYFIFVGRLDSKKGLELLIKAFNSVKNKPISLKIIGTKNEYSDKLESLVSQLNLTNKISFLGGVFGNDKYKYIANSRAMITPSYSEAIGMVNLEGAACRVPVITTFKTGLNKEWNSNGGVLINPSSNELEFALAEAVTWNEFERKDRGNKLCEFVFNNYSWQKKGSLWNELYNQV